MSWIVDQSNKPVARLAGSSIVNPSDTRVIIGFIRENRIYSWMGNQVGFLYGRDLADTTGRTVGRIAEAEDLVLPDATRQLVNEPDQALRAWWRFLPEPPRVRARPDDHVGQLRAD